MDRGRNEEDAMADVMPAACEGCGLSRREFVGRSTLAAVTALLASACGGTIDAVTNALDPAGGGSVTINLADYPALANVGGIAKVSTGGAPVAVVRQGASTFVAFSMSCPHAGTTINISGGGFVCPNHGARFNAAGQWTGGQSTSALSSVPVTYDSVAGTLTLGAVPNPGTGGGDDDDEDDDD
jgi:Rieske Fe-S protein